MVEVVAFAAAPGDVALVVVDKAGVHAVGVDRVQPVVARVVVVDRIPAADNAGSDVVECVVGVGGTKK